MSYTAEISRSNPTCFLFLVDQSGSMQDNWGQDQSQSKGSKVAQILNRLVQTFSIRCAKEEGVRGYFDIGAIGYGGKVDSALQGLFPGERFISISKLADQPLRISEVDRKVEDGAGGLVVQKYKVPVWFEEVSNSGTPMCEAVALARDWVSEWIERHPDAYPPTVINISDGEPTDGDPTQAAAALKGLVTQDGAALMYNICISSESNTNPIVFPDSSVKLPDQYAQLMFEMSSVLPEAVRLVALSEYGTLTDTSRGLVYQASPESLITFLDIGTRTSNLR